MRNYILIFFSAFHLFCFSQKKDSLQLIAYSKQSDSIKIDALYKLFFQEVYKDLNTSKKYYNDIFRIAKSKNSYFAYAKGYNCKGVFYDITGKLDSAHYFYDRAIFYGEKSSSQSVVGSAYNNIGLLDWNKGNYLKAIKNYNKALEIFEAIKREDLQANTLSNIGLVYFDLDESGKSEQYLIKALNIRKRIDDDYGLSVSYVNLGQLFEKQKKYQLAVQNFNKGIAIKEKIEDYLGIAIAKYNMSMVHLKLNHPHVAIKYLKESEAICLKNKAESNIVENVYIGLIDSYLEIKNIELAKSYNKKLFELAKKINDNDRLSHYYDVKSKIGVLENNYKEAYQNYIIFDSLKKITNGLELKKSLTLFETKYQTAKKEKLLLEKEIEAKEKNTTILALLLIVLFGALLALLIYRQQRLKHKQQEHEFDLQTAIGKVEAKNDLHQQRLSISRDLHDNIGAQLTFVISSVDNLKFSRNITDLNINNQLNLISDFTKATILELRDTIWAMNSDTFTFEDLRSRIFNFVEIAQSSSSSFNISFIIEEPLLKYEISSLTAITIYRVTQEAINNSIKHSKGSKIDVKIRALLNQIKVTIYDDGIGFNKETVIRGNGIFNMQKRIEEIGGVFELQSTLGKGTLIQIIV
ncbi:tetratricopeptide repeat-containing sensor histidine kinase [Flavobacterium sp.]